jgi:hypothetical protein
MSKGVGETREKRDWTLFRLDEKREIVCGNK